MDFVIFGMGLGATLVVLGWFWRTLGPRLRHRPPNGALLSGEQMVARISWTRFCRSGGAVWVLGGCLLLFAALASLLLHLSDSTGARVLLAAFLVVALGVIAWLWAYLRRFGLIGLVAPHEPKPVSAPAPAARLSLRRQRQPQPAAAAAPVQGPMVPVDLVPAPVAGPPVPLASNEPAREDAATVAAATAPVAERAATTGTAPAAGAGASEATSSGQSGDATTVIGAERGRESRDEAPAVAAEAEDGKPVQDAETSGTDDAVPANVEVRDRDIAEQAGAGVTADDAATAAAPASDDARVPDQADAGGDAASTVTRAEAAGNGRAQPAGERRFGSAAFREAVARQEAHLARAAGSSPPAGSQPDPRAVDQPARSARSERQASDAREHHAPPRRFPAPRGTEGVQWVRAGDDGRVSGGFAIKGDPATRLYYAAGSDSYDRAPAHYFFASTRDAEAAGYHPAPAIRRAMPSPERTRPDSAAQAVSPAPPREAPPAPDGVEGRDWVRGDDTNTVPAGFPVKGNASSRLYHPVGTRFYDRTVAEFYFASPERAEAAGYQLPRVLRAAGQNAAGAASRPARTGPNQPHATNEDR